MLLLLYKSWDRMPSFLYECESSSMHPEGIAKETVRWRQTRGFILILTSEADAFDSHLFTAVMKLDRLPWTRMDR